jgi:hypothetical protein
VREGGGADFPTVLEGGQRGAGQAGPVERPPRRGRALARRQCVERQSQALEHERARRIRTTESAPAIDQGRQVLALQGLGPKRAGLLVPEFFAWRQLAQRRQLGALAGLPPTP